MRLFLGVAVAVLAGVVPPHAARNAPTNDEDAQALASVVHDLCHREVAMLGESSTHGDGHTEAFKVELVERLINECGYDSVLFEANHAEFIDITRTLRTGQPVSVDRVSAAVGGLWKFDLEFQPLIPFLLANAKTGVVSLGGIDDQLGQLGQDYANVSMIAELTGLLPPERRTACSLALHRRIYSDYSAAAPYAVPDRVQIADCLVDMRIAVIKDKTATSVSKEERREMIDSVRRWISRDFEPRPQQIVQRDQSMFQNFQWLRRQVPLRHKVILWAATVHIARQADPKWGDGTGTNFGWYVHRTYGADAYSLGFTAFGGSYRQGRETHSMPTPPEDSLEGRAIDAEQLDTVYLSSNRLAAMGTLPGEVFVHSFETLDWANFLDGIVVFHAEKPPSSSRP